MLRLVRGSLYWMGLWAFYTAIILALGAFLGGVCFIILGPLFVEMTFIDFLKKGVWIGFRYAGVWAGGMAIVLCIMKARKTYLVKDK